MSKAVLISIRPEWVRKILNGSKTVEIRKTAPKCGVPVRCYIYQLRECAYLLLTAYLSARRTAQARIHGEDTMAWLCGTALAV